MGIIIYSPSWFSGLDIALQLISVFVSFLLFITSYKLFKISKEKGFLYFALAFFSISAAYVSKIFADWFTYTNIGKDLPHWINLLFYNLTTLEFVNIFGNLGYRFLLLLGFLILIFVFLKIKDKRIVFLFMYFTFIISAFSVWSFLLFQTTVTVFAGTIALYYLLHYFENKRRTVLLSLIGFGMIFVAQFSFLFTFFLEKIMFVIGHIFQAAGFLILLTTYIMVLKK
jgi:hypothetical protein